MKAIVYSASEGLRLETQRSEPGEADQEAIIEVILAGVCSTDLEIVKGYVPGYDSVLGHEFVGRVLSCKQKPDLVRKRIVGEINCPLDDSFSVEDPCFMRNHYPRRTVLGIIGRDGAMSQQLRLPAANLHLVPDSISDKEAVFTEPLAAALRILEQKVIAKNEKVAVVGDGKLGLLAAQLVAVNVTTEPLHIGRHQEKLALVKGTRPILLEANGELPDKEKQAYDVVIEATGTSRGVITALELTRPMGTVVQKSTCSIDGDRNQPAWSQIANDVVVNEKKLMGSRCGPFPAAIEALQLPEVKNLLHKMVTAVFPVSKGIEAFDKARSKGCLKVLINMRE